MVRRVAVEGAGAGPRAGAVRPPRAGQLEVGVARVEADGPVTGAPGPLAAYPPTRGRTRVSLALLFLVAWLSGHHPPFPIDRVEKEVCRRECEPLWRGLGLGE